MNWYCNLSALVQVVQSHVQKDVPTSHYCMMGGPIGKMAISDARMNDFRDACKADIESGERMPSVSEIHTSVFPFYLDIDVKMRSAAPLTEFYVRVVACLQETIASFFPDRSHADGDLASSSGARPFRVVLCEKHRATPGEANFHEWEEFTFDEEERGTDSSPPLREVATPPQSLLARLARGQTKFSRGEWGTDETLAGFVPLADEYVSVPGDEAGGGGAVRRFRPTDRTWKHGAHVHVPELLVDVNRVALVRESFLARLERESWKGLLGFDPSYAQWRDIVDEAVYKNQTGLRLIGAPKAKRCPVKHEKAKCCSLCRMMNYGNVVEPNFYWPTRVFRGFDREEEGSRLRVRPRCEEDQQNGIINNVARALRNTTVRSPVDATPTPGFSPPPGCPPVPQSSIFYSGASASGASRKKKMIEREAMGDTATGGKRQRGETKKTLVTDSAVNAAIRKVVSLFGSYYDNCVLVAKEDGKGGFEVAFRGNGATYCLNKDGYHASSTPKVKLRPVGAARKAYVATMYCWSQKQVQYGRGLCYCSDWSRQVDVPTNLVDVLVTRSAKGGGGTLTEAARQSNEAVGRTLAVLEARRAMMSAAPAADGRGR